MCGFSPTPTQNLIQPKIRQSRAQKSTFKHNLGVNHSALQGLYIFHQEGVTKRGVLQLIPLFDDLSCLKASRRLPKTQQNRFKNIPRGISEFHHKGIYGKPLSGNQRTGFSIAHRSNKNICRLSLVVKKYYEAKIRDVNEM